MIKRYMLFVVAVVLAASEVSAQEVSPECPERPENEAKARKLAGKWFSRGEVLVEEKRYTEALGAFGCSLRMVEHPATLMNAGQAAQLAGNKKAAHSHYHRYLELEPNGARADEARVHVAAFEIELAPEPEPDEEMPPPEPEPEPEPEEAMPPEPVDDGPNLKVIGGVLLGVGGAGLILGAVFQGLAVKARSNGEDTSDYAQFQDQKDSMKSFQVGAIVSFAVGAAAAATGMIMLAAGEKNTSEGEISVRLDPYPGGLALKGTF